MLMITDDPMILQGLMSYFLKVLIRVSLNMHGVLREEKIRNKNVVTLVRKIGGKKRKED